MIFTLCLVGYWGVAFLVLGMMMAWMDGMNKEMEAQGEKPIDLGVLILAAFLWPVTGIVVLGMKIGSWMERGW